MAMVAGPRVITLVAALLCLSPIPEAFPQCDSVSLAFSVLRGRANF